MARRPDHPWFNPAIAVELTMRERRALCSQDDWGENVDRVLAQPVTTAEWPVELLAWVRDDA